jgi:hypothetical protein
MITKILSTVSALAALSASASAGSLTRSTDVDATPAAVWSAIGPFCAIKDWHPAIATCTDDGKTPPTRTLVTKDGKATFVEPETARDDAKHLYSYTFVGQPLPVSQYEGTIKVLAKADGTSTVVWHGTYTPLAGKDKEVKDALTGIYESGLAAIKTKFAK